MTPSLPSRNTQSSLGATATQSPVEEPLCGGEAEDIATKERISCRLPRGHSDEHFWSEVEGNCLRSASWIATEGTPFTYIGVPQW